MGRLPWRDLGIDELRDGEGEPLWYAIDGAFRGGSSNSRPINSDTRPNLLYHRSPAHPAEPIVAVILAPGAPLPGQRRTADTRLDRHHYFESFGPADNRRPGGPYMNGVDQHQAPALNDRLLAITPPILFDVIERRVGNELHQLLQSYRARHGRWPAAAVPDSPACRRSTVATRPEDGCLPAAGRCSGRLPAPNLLNYRYEPSRAVWQLLPSAQRITVPAWLNVNLWHQVTFYAVDGNLIDGAALPTAAQPCRAGLQLDGRAHAALLILPGAPGEASGRQVQPYSAQLADYLIDPANQSAWTVGLPLDLHSPSRPNRLLLLDPIN
ncbi:hypothetical protein [Chitinimonas lacunae]|uniref:Uncharacterized protein n=1 Tax=Chitinimonas lacunae TaxID=1963018 RepID=A0ABV8MR45_9NEIS